MSVSLLGEYFTDNDILNSTVINAGEKTKEYESENLKQEKQKPPRSEMINVFDITSRGCQTENPFSIQISIPCQSVKAFTDKKVLKSKQPKFSDF